MSWTAAVVQVTAAGERMSPAGSGPMGGPAIPFGCAATNGVWDP